MQSKGYTMEGDTLSDMLKIGGSLVGQLLGYIVKNDVQYAYGFQIKFQEMKKSLDCMSSLLMDTENMRNNMSIIKTTLVQVRDIVYEADDIMIDCLVRVEYHKEGFSLSSIKDIFFRYKTGRLLTDFNRRIRNIEEILQRYLTIPKGIPGDSSQLTTSRSNLFLNESDIVGLENDVDILKEWILGKDRVFEGIGIVGMGGIGKTTLATKVMSKKEVARGFEKLIWVTVSQTFNDLDIMKNMLKQLGQDDYSAINDGKVLLKMINQRISGKSCLIFLDDVWIYPNWWQGLSSVIERSSGKNCCFLVTSRKEDVVMQMGVEPSRIHHLKVLSQEEGWILFCKVAFSSRKGICPDKRLEEIGMDIVKKCGGLPLAIKTISALMASKKLPSEWKKICDSFHRETMDGSNEIMTSLRLSFDELPSRIKLCFLTLSVYPEESIINTEQLIHWWIGESFVLDQNSQTAKEIGYDHLTELVSRCLIEPVKRRGYDGRVYSCRIHDMTRELIIRVVEDEGFCSFDDKGRQKMEADSRWLGVSKKIHMQKLKGSRKLRALLLMPTSSVDFDKNINMLLSLRVLDLSYMKLDVALIDQLLIWICKSLRRLAQLNLSGLVGLKEVPSSIRKLQNLQLLILNGCIKLSKVHPLVTSLKRLLILDFRSCPLQYLPQELGKLSCLQELSGFKVTSKAETRAFGLCDLLKLTHLRVLRMDLSDDSEILENEIAMLSELKELKVLSISTEDCAPGSDILETLDRLLPPPHLQELYLRCYPREKMPKWCTPGHLSRLQYLCIENGDLVDLSLRKEEDGHPSWIIEGLCLKYLKKLELEWEIVENNMPSLNYVEVSNCHKLKSFPCSVGRLGTWRKALN